MKREERIPQDKCPHTQAFRNKDGTMECSECGNIWESLQSYVLNSRMKLSKTYTITR